MKKWITSHLQYVNFFFFCTFFFYICTKIFTMSHDNTGNINLLQHTCAITLYLDEGNWTHISFFFSNFVSLGSSHWKTTSQQPGKLALYLIIFFHHYINIPTKEHLENTHKHRCDSEHDSIFHFSYTVCMHFYHQQCQSDIVYVITLASACENKNTHSTLHSQLSSVHLIKNVQMSLRNRHQGLIHSLFILKLTGQSIPIHTAKVSISLYHWWISDLQHIQMSHIQYIREMLLWFVWSLALSSLSLMRHPMPFGPLGDTTTLTHTLFQGYSPKELNAVGVALTEVQLQRWTLCKARKEAPAERAVNLAIC